MSSLSGSGQGRFYIIGNCISYYIKKGPITSCDGPVHNSVFFVLLTYTVLTPLYYS